VVTADVVSCVELSLPSVLDFFIWEGGEVITPLVD
jgi:hypothetical protein